MDFTNVLTCDTEVYENYFLVMFKKMTTGEVLYFEKFNDSELDRASIFHIINKYTIVTFNGIKFDTLILEAALAGFNNKSIKHVCNLIIPPKVKGEEQKRGMQPWQVRKQLGISALQFDHIDLIEIAPLTGSLKIYAGRLHAKRMQDLPIEPDAIILKHQVKPMRKYCVNDNDNTGLLCRSLEKEIDLRCEMSKEYDIDLRSKSDAQIAEAVIKHELKKRYNIVPKKPTIKANTKVYYKAPENLEFKTDVMKEIFGLFKSEYFLIGASGHVELKTGKYLLDEDGEPLRNPKNNKKIDLPHNLYNKTFVLGETMYKVGMGGLHSCEKKTSHVKGKYLLKDYDVASFYPRIILNNKLFPRHIGIAFLKIYNSIVNIRLKAKKEGNTVVAESLKITINGLFGKLASKYSFVYSPDLMMQVTITGQLSLLMLIERLELEGVSVVSGNTDGIVVKMLPEQEQLVEDIVLEWEIDTDYIMESSEYLGLYSRDVNNYIAVAEDKIKAIGQYADPHIPKNKLKTNPTSEICPIAVKAYLRDATPIEDTINECDDITKFTSIRTVNGGAIKDGEHIGKVIRWYYGKNELTDIYYKTSGNKVPRSDGAVPLMDLPDELPTDIDHQWYINESYKFLKEIGAT